MKIVWVKWLDSMSHGGARWHSQEEFEPMAVEDMTCESSGFLVDESDHAITIVQSINSEEWHSEFVIPKGCIVKMKELHVGRT
jgi:hypothetical protein